MTSQTIETRAVISAEDKTGGAFAAVIKKLENVEAAARKADAANVSTLSQKLHNVEKISASLEKSDAVSRRMVQSLSTIGSKHYDNLVAAERMVDRMSAFGREAEKAARKVSRLESAMRSVSRAAKAMEPIVEGYAGEKLLHGTKEAVRSGAEIQHEKVQMAASGMTPAELSEASTRAWEAQSKYPNIKVADALERWKEARSVLPHQDEVPKLYDTIMQANSAMNIVDPSGQMGGSIQYILKAAETLGRTLNPERFKAFMDAAVRAQQVMGKTITPEDILTSAQQFKTGGVTLSDRFMNTTALSLTQEMPGGQGAHGVFEATKILGGSLGHNNERIAAWIAAGLLDKKDVIKNKNGTYKGVKLGKTVKGGLEGVHDPDLYTWNTLVPALEKMGYDSPEKRAPIFNKMFPATAANVIAKFDQQVEAWKNHAMRLGESLGMSATSTTSKDPIAAWKSLTTSVENFGGTAAGPAMPYLAGGADWAAHAVGANSALLNAWQKNHPILSPLATGAAGAGGAGIAGYLGWRAFNGMVSQVAKAWGEGLEGAGGKAATEAVTDAVVKSTAKSSPDLLSRLLTSPVSIAALPVITMAEGEIGTREALMDEWRKLTPEQRKRLTKNSPLMHPKSVQTANVGAWDKGTYAEPPSGYERDFTLGSDGGFSKTGMLLPPSKVGYVSQHTLRRSGGDTPTARQAPQIVSVNFEPAMLRVEVTASSSLLSIAEKAKSIELKPRSDAPGGVGETTTEQH